MPNLNAALACAQLERLPAILAEKRALAASYADYFAQAEWAEFLAEPDGNTSNYWLCAISVDSMEVRDEFLKSVNDAGVMVRPIWKLMTDLPMYKNCQHGNIENAVWLQERVLNLPSGVK